MREAAAGPAGCEIGHELAHRPAKPPTERANVVEAPRAVEKGNGLLGAQSRTGVVLERAREGSLHTENDPPELMLQANLSAVNRGVMVSGEALPGYADDGEGRVTIREECVVLRPLPSRVDPEIEPTPVRGTLVGDPCLTLVAVGVCQPCAAERRDGYCSRSGKN